MPAGPGAWAAVDEGDALGFEAGEVALEVIGEVGDVVQARTASLEKATHGGFGTQRFDQLHVADECDADALGREGFRWSAEITGEELEGASALFDGVDGDGNVVE